MNEIETLKNNRFQLASLTFNAKAKNEIRPIVLLPVAGSVHFLLNHISEHFIKKPDIESCKALCCYIY